MMRRALIVALAMISANVPLLASPASAATSPQLLTVSVDSNQVTAPGQVTLSYTAQSDVAILGAVGSFRAPDSKTYRIAMTAGPSGSGTLTIPNGVANGAWALVKVTLWSSAGATLACSTPAVAPCNTLMDLSAGDFTVSGSTPDEDAPLVTSVSLPSSPVQPGQPLTVSWTAQEAHTLTSASFTFVNLAPEAHANQVVVRSSSLADLATGHVTVPLAMWAYNGDYQLQSLSVADNFGNTATYQPDGSVVPGGGATGPTAHSLDFAAVKFSVTGSTEDVAPPQLVSLHVSYPGDPHSAQVDYVTTDASQQLKSVQLTYIAPDGSQSGWGFFNGAQLSGSVPVSLPYGAYHLSSVLVTDAHGNPMEYRRDGSTYNALTKVTGSHSLNFAQFDLMIRPMAVVNAYARSVPFGAELGWSLDGAYAPEDLVGLTAFQITVNPGGRVITVPIHLNNLFQIYTVTGLRNGVNYTFSITEVGGYNQAGLPVSVAMMPMMSDHIFSAGDDNRDRRDDLWAYGGLTRSFGSLWFYGRSGASYGTRHLNDDQGPGRYVAAGDVNRDGNGDTWLVDYMGELVLEQGDGRGGVWERLLWGTGWANMRFLIGGSDFTGDGTPDLLAVRPSGDLYLYPTEWSSTRGLGLGARRYVGSGWQNMLSVFSPGDFNGDGKADLLAVDTNGVLWLYPGNGRGGFLPRAQAGTGWAAFGAVFALRDFNGDGRADVGAVDLAGNLYVYPGTGTGRFTARSRVGTAWNMFF